MSEAIIHAALINSHIALNLALPVADEGKIFKPVAGEPWQEVFNLPASRNVSSNGVGGMDERLGVFQINITYPIGAGIGELLAMADLALEFYTAGKRFYEGSQCVRVVRSERTAVRPVDGWQRVTVSVYYSAHTIRPEV